MSMFKLKTIDEVLDSANQNKSLEKNLNVWHLLLLGLGAIIGTGIFGMTGIAAVNMSGPAIIISYAIAGTTAIFIALSYTEVATMIPTSGGAYSYTFVAFGEIAAWIVSWMLILYFITSTSAVAIAWSGYIVSMLHEEGINIPFELTKSPFENGVVNFPAVLVILAVTMLLFRGTKKSVTINVILVIIKVTSIALFVYVAAPHFNTSNWLEYNHPLPKLYLSSPFMPFGITGVVSGSAFVFFAYNGFDSIVSAAEESKDPKRDLILAILGSLFICMTLYIIVAALLVGTVPFNLIQVSSPITGSLKYNGHNIISPVIAGGVVFGMISIIIAQLFALSRVIIVVARDRLLPDFLTKIHKEYNTPYISIIILGLLSSITAGFMPLEIIGTLSCVGSLFSFIIVCLAMMVLRCRYPDVKRPFKCFAPYFIGSVGVLLCLILLISTVKVVGLYSVVWLGLGIMFYFLYYIIRKKQ